MPGPIWKFYIGGDRVVIASQKLMNEVCDEERFSKIIAASLGQVRNGTHGMPRLASHPLAVLTGA